jgi:hypothetical protein
MIGREQPLQHVSIRPLFSVVASRATVDRGARRNRENGR